VTGTIDSRGTDGALPPPDIPGAVAAVATLEWDASGALLYCAGRPVLSPFMATDLLGRKLASNGELNGPEAGGSSEVVFFHCLDDRSERLPNVRLSVIAASPFSAGLKVATGPSCSLRVDAFRSSLGRSFWRS
jgi:hypothetical protein